MTTTHKITSSIIAAAAIVSVSCSCATNNAHIGASSREAVTASCVTSTTTPKPEKLESSEAETSEAEAETKAAEKETSVSSSMTEATSQTTTTVQTTTGKTTAVTTTKATTTTAATTPAPKWTESKTSGTKYVTVGCYARKEAVLGAQTVKLYSVNDKVTVVAKTNTDYYKLDDGTFIHADYLSDSKVVIQTTITTALTIKPAIATTTAKEAQTEAPAVDDNPDEAVWSFTEADCLYIIEQCHKWADENGHKYRTPGEIPDYDGTYEINPDGPYYDVDDNWIGLYRSYGEVYKHSSWDTTYETHGKPYTWLEDGFLFGTGNGANSKKEEMSNLINAICEDIEYYSTDGYTPVVDYTPYNEFVSYAKGRPGWAGCSDLELNDEIDYIFFVIYAA